MKQCFLRIAGLFAATFLCLATAGCQPQQSLWFPEKPDRIEPLPDGGQRIWWTVSEKGVRFPYVQETDATGQVVRIKACPELAAHRAAGLTGWEADLRAIDRSTVPHLVMILDGPPLVTLEAMRKEGRFRLFPAPARMFAPFPAMTDLGINQIMGTGPSPGYEARHFDRRANRVVGGTGDYVEAANSPWIRRVDYRISWQRDADAYLHPTALFHDEMAGMMRAFSKAKGFSTLVGYTVGTTAMATSGGERAVREYLSYLDRFCQQITYERRGQVSFTITGDHGHNLTAGKRVSFVKFLEAAGWTVGKSLTKDNDVVEIDYGLVTYAAFYTKSPAKLADALLKHEATELVMYPDGAGGVIVLRPPASRSGTVPRACITRAPGPAPAPGSGIAGAGSAFRCEMLAGDPLGLAPIIDKLKADGKVSPEGFIDEDAMFRASATHDYPDPLRRIWFAFNGIALNPADVLVSLRDPFHHGSPFFDAFVKRASTHGSLNRINGETFVLTNRCPVPPLVEQDRVLSTVGVTWATAATPIPATAKRQATTIPESPFGALRSK